MRAWRLVARQYATDPLSGEGALRYGGRWNSPGVRIAYLADSLALATLELSVHLRGARVTYMAIELDIPDSLVTPVGDLKRRWQTDEPATRSAGDAWVKSANSLALSVPSALVDARSREHNLLVNSLDPRRVQVTEVQRFEVVLDERL
jgi:RES domain-containing protein